LISLIGGASLSIAIAWWQILENPVRGSERQFIAAPTDSGEIRQFILVTTASRAGVEAVAFTATDAMRWHNLDLRVQEQIPETPRWAPWPHTLALEDTKLYVACGWPARCLVAECAEQDARWYRSDSELNMPDEWLRDRLREYPSHVRVQTLRLLARPPVKTPPQWTDALVLVDQQRDGPFTAEILPYGIIPVGLIANSLLYASLIAAVLGGTVWAQRLTRLARGLCPRCAYQLSNRKVSGCPECGWHRGVA
jgi:hypothetical protein